MPVTRVHIVHGYTAAPDDHWFPWLSQTLATEGISTNIPAMPDSAQPRLDAWCAHLEREIGTPGPQDILIGHSLGCITLLQFLQQQTEPLHFAGLILVAGFDRQLPDLPELEAFVRPDYDAAKIRRLAGQRVSIASRDDSVVPYRFSAALAERLDSGLYSVEHGGHFLGREGFLTLPLLHAQIHAMLRRNQPA